jgi:hypothetical protein
MIDVFKEINRIFDEAAPKLPTRRHKALFGCCQYCDGERDRRNEFHPSHDASERCQSGKRRHCSCDICF